MFSLDQPISETSFLAKRLRAPLKKLGIETVADLVFCFPRTYEDRSEIVTLRDMTGAGLPAACLSGRQGQAGTATVLVQIKAIKNRRSFKSKIYLTEASITDETGAGRVLWFNQPYLVKNLMPGTKVWLSGKYKSDMAGPLFSSPTYEIARQTQVHTGRIIPIYGSLGAIPQKSFRRIMHDCLARLEAQKEWLPQNILKENNLIGASEALQEIHFPTDWKSLKNAAKRFKFEELYLLSLRSELSRAEIVSEKAVPVEINIDRLKKFIATLPFPLTNSQRKAAWEIIKDASLDKPMNRMLDGDVGSGKTAVAAIAAFAGAASGGQTIIMAPTEILAKQHYATFQKMFAPSEMSVGLLTANEALNSATGTLTRVALMKDLKSGKINLLVGTHAVLFCAQGASASGGEKLIFKNLVLSVIDEQHRFGVEQRRALKNMRQDAHTPHLLSMTATPIPRSLALAFYGDLDMSVLSEMPPGRLPVRTLLVAKANQGRAYEEIKKKINAGEQAFVICPLIDPSEKLTVHSAKAEYDNFRNNIFPGVKVGLLHGRMKPKEKEKAMAEFKENKISVLVSTSVVEVGVDIPNATSMIILGAERFGLSQLHQFRGRIGRGQKESACYVFLENAGPNAYARLKAFANTSDGFALAEQDLALRGPGEIFGTMQSGGGELRIATFADIEIAVAARASARALIASDPKLKTVPSVREKMLQTEKTIHLE